MTQKTKRYTSVAPTEWNTARHALTRFGIFTHIPSKKQASKPPGRNKARNRRKS